jgi:ankyrin repeat protein
MTPQLPARPDLAQLKKQAKDLLAAARAGQPAALARFRALPAFASLTDAALVATPLALHDAQSALAREHGCPSWTALRELIEERTLEFTTAVARFTRDSVEQHLGRAERVLRLFPDLVARDFHAALAYGDVATVRRHITARPELATQPGGPLGWEPLLYVAHSRWAARDTAGLTATARLLLAHGADANASYRAPGDPASPLSALWAAACHARNLPLAQLLLEHGARPDDGESVYHAAEQGDIEMLDLLATHGAQADGGVGRERWGNTPLYFILGHYAGLAFDEKVRRGARWLLAHGANPNRVCYPDKSGETPLHAAARHWDGAMIELLLAHGADLHARRRDGRTALALALLHGRTSAANALRAAGADATLSAAEQFLAACMRGDRAEALRLRDPAVIAAHPHLLAEAGPAATETMLDAGFDVAATGGLGETALHWACFTGNLAKARILIARGAPLDLRDRTHRSLPIGWCHYAFVNQPAPDGDYLGVARALLEGGATPPTDAELEAYVGGDELIALIVDHRRRSRG